MQRSLDTQLVRKAFPAMRDDYVFMDNAGGSQILQSVIDRVQEYWKTANVQHGASYAVSQDASKRVAQAKEMLAELLNAAQPQELVMGGSSSLLIRLLSISMGRSLQAGDQVIVSRADHEANVSPWRDLERQGIQIIDWDFDKNNFSLSLEELRKILSSKTKVVSLCHCSNILGAIHEIRPIADLVHQYEAKLVVDGVAYAPHRLVDVQAMDVDFYIYSFYKTFGPHYAVMYGKKQNWLELPGLNHYFIREDDIPYKMEPGGVNYELVYGLLGLGDYFQMLAKEHGAAPQLSRREQFKFAFELIAQHEAALSERLLQFLNSKQAVQILGPNTSDPQQRVSTIAFHVKGKDSAEIVQQVDPHNIGIRYGDFYAKNIVNDLGLTHKNGVVRVSMVHYNTLEEVDRLIHVLDDLF